MNTTNFKKRFYNGGTDKKRLVKEIKSYFKNYQELTEFLDKLKSEMKPLKNLFKTSILGDHYLPKNNKELHAGDFQYFSEETIVEINWQVLGFLECSEIINKFLDFKKQFEINLLKGDYVKARTLLDKIENEICISFWSIENRFILDEYQFGSERNWETRNKILDEKNSVFVQVFGSLTSFKTEKSVSFFQFNEEFNNWRETFGPIQSESFFGILEYFRYKLNFFSYPKFDLISEILYREGSSSIIDRYLTFVRIAQLLISEESKETEDLIKIIRELKIQISDILLKQLIIATDPLIKITKDEINLEIIEILDEYTKGNYENCINITKEYIIEKNCTDIELIKIYVKSMIELNLEYIEIAQNKSMLNQICFNIYNILSKNLNTDQSLVELLKLSYTLNNSYIGLKIYSFISEELGWESLINLNLLDDLNSNFINPILISKLYTREPQAKNYINTLETNLPSSPTIRLYKQFYDNFKNTKLTDEFKYVSKNKEILYKIRTLNINGEIRECINLCETSLLNPDISNVIQYEILNYLYHSYVKENDIRKAIILYVSTYLKNSHLTKKMQVDELNNRIIKSKFKIIGDKSTLIELPILLKISNIDKIKIKQSYELFLTSNDINKPSELIELSNIFNKNKLIFFLKNVCVTEIMQLSKSFNSSYEVNEERIKIIKYLTEIDILEIESYKNEIAELTQKNTISKVIGGIDERKIFVNEYKIRENLKRSEKQNVLIKEQISPLTNESFDRYVKLLAYVKNNNEFKDVSSIIQIGDNGQLKYLEIKKNKTYKDEEIDFVLYLPAFRIFVTYFLNIRDLFIFSKEFGLDAYLSTRIRHGTLPNHLRSVFETYYLVTAQTDNIYSENNYWKDRLNLIPENMEVLQNSLSQFSKEIDNFSKEIKDNFVQCKNEQKNEKSESLFDYYYSEQDLIFLFLESFEETENIDIFIEKSFNELWHRTEINLEIVRSKFNVDFRDKYIELIDKLQLGLNSINDKNSISELLNNLMTCRTEIQTKLSNISKWFRRSESSFDGEYEIQILAETSIQITKNLNPNFNFEIEKEICLNFNISGEFHQHIIDLINNCLFNIVKHAQLPSEEINAKLIIQEEENNIVITIENYLSNSSLHLEKLLAIKENWGSSDSNISKEGGTGFPKIKKIINSDLNRKYSDFKFNLINNKLSIILSFETNGLKV